MTNQSKAFLCALGTVLAWSTVSTAFKLALQSLSPMQLIAISMATASLFLLLTLCVQKQEDVLRAFTPKQWRCALLLGCMLYVYYFVLFVAYANLPAQIAQPINYTWAIMLTLLVSWLLKQRLRLISLAWMLFAYAGVVLITTGSASSLGPLNPLGLACVLVSTFLYACYWTVNTKSALPALPGLFVCFSVAFVLAACTVFIQGETLRIPWQALASGVYVGLFELAIPFLLWEKALRLTSCVARISTLPFLVPFLALFWISLILHEPIAWTTILGLVIIVTGTFMLQKSLPKQGG